MRPDVAHHDRDDRQRGQGRAHVVSASIRATSNSRRMIPKAAALVATAMKAVTVVGAPS